MEEQDRHETSDVPIPQIRDDGMAALMGHWRQRARKFYALAGFDHISITRLWPIRLLTKGQCVRVRRPSWDMARTLGQQQSSPHTGHATDAAAPRPDSPQRWARLYGTKP